MQFGVVLSALLLLATSYPARDDSSESVRIIEMPGFTVVGISVRTNNAREMSGNGVIGKQWQRLYGEHLLEKIPGPADSNVIAVYTDYVSDARGDYTFVLGVKVTSAENIPPGLVVKNIPAAKYAVFTTSKGPAAQVVSKAWQKIWTLPKSAPGGDRAYGADFELYDRRAANPDTAQVDIYVTIH